MNLRRCPRRPFQLVIRRMPADLRSAPQSAKYQRAGPNTQPSCVQAAKQTLDRACAACRAQVDESSARLQAELRAAVDPDMLAQLRAFVDTASAERESLKRSLTAAVKVRNGWLRLRANAQGAARAACAPMTRCQALLCSCGIC